jgi:CBS-domain-containing membrane protein
VVLLRRIRYAGGGIRKAHGRKAADIMTRDVVSVTEQASVADIVERPASRIKRVPVRGGRPGIVSPGQFVRLLATQPGPSPELAAATAPFGRLVAEPPPPSRAT